MAPHDDRHDGEGPPAAGTALLLAASEWLYGALLALYPKAFRRRYAAEMRRDFRELSQEGLEEGGGTELVRVWGAAFSDLAVTALKERSTVTARSAYVSVDPRIATRAMVAVVLVAVTVAVASLSITPQYEASVMILVGEERKIIETSNDASSLEQLTQTMTEGVASRPVAEGTIKQLGLRTTPENLIANLSVEQVPQTQFIQVNYSDSSPQRAQRVANTVGDVFSQRVFEVSPSADSITATLWERAVLPDEPASPNPLRNGLLALVSGLLLCVVLAFTLPRVAALGLGRAALPATRAVVDQPASGSRTRPTGAPATEAAKEKELLEALGRRGALTVAGVALETSLSVTEADRMLSALAANGHLEVSVAPGRLLYSLWEDDAPL
jgi:capsular polysaccharide biosynthesis protein